MLKMKNCLEVAELREKFPNGTRIELLEMKDTQAPPRHTQGTVFRVDDYGNILMHWDNGSSLSLLYGIDKFIKV